MLIAAAPSKVPFYIAGGLLVLWALILALNGIRRPDFPGSQRGRRGVIGITVLLVLGATSMAVLTAGEETGGEAAAAASSDLTLTADPSGAIAFDKTSATVKGGTVTVTLVNDSQIGHNVAVARGSQELGHTPTISQDKATVKVDLKPGEYEFYCTVPGHRAAGMEGKLTVQ